MTKFYHVFYFSFQMYHSRRTGRTVDVLVSLGICDNLNEFFITKVNTNCFVSVVQWIPLNCISDDRILRIGGHSRWKYFFSKLDYNNAPVNCKILTGEWIVRFSDIEFVSFTLCIIVAMFRAHYYSHYQAMFSDSASEIHLYCRKIFIDFFTDSFIFFTFSDDVARIIYVSIIRKNICTYFIYIHMYIFHKHFQTRSKIL